MARVFAVATFEYVATQAGDLSFAPGDRIEILQQNTSGWWVGRADDGRQGLFPYNRVRVMDQAPQSPARPALIIDRVNGIQVKPGAGEAGTACPAQEFEVELVTSGGLNLKARRQMKHFRVLCQAWNTMFKSQNPQAPTLYVSANGGPEEAIPEWADLVRLPSAVSTSKTVERSDVLTRFLNLGIGDPARDYLVVLWMDPQAKFSLDEQTKNSVKQILLSAQNDYMRRPPLPDPELARTAYPWVKRDNQEISFQKHEIVSVDKETQFQGWWMGEKYNGGKGLFPYNYVKLLTAQEAGEVLHESPGLMKQSSLAEPEPQRVGIFANLVGLGGAEDNNKYTRVRSTVFTPLGQSTTPRARKRVEKYSLVEPEAFDELLQFGVTIEENGKLYRYQGGQDSPKRGDTVVLLYSGYIWAPQSQELLEFASSDKLIDSNPNNRQKATPLEFTIGTSAAIDGIEEAVVRLKLNKPVRVTLTPEKAYGDVGYPPDIPGNSYLVYDLTLTTIKKGQNNGVAANMTGVAKSSIAQRKPDEESGKFAGAASVRNLAQNQQQLYRAASNSRLQNFARTPGSEFSPAAPNTVDAGPVDSETFKKKLTLAKLQDIVRHNQLLEYGIKHSIIEEYLTDDEFSKAFHVDHFTWLLMPAQARAQRKKAVGLD